MLCGHEHFYAHVTDKKAAKPVARRIKKVVKKWAKKPVKTVGWRSAGRPSAGRSGARRAK